jgi:hypothetical protein
MLKIAIFHLFEERSKVSLFEHFFHNYCSYLVDVLLYINFVIFGEYSAHILALTQSNIAVLMTIPLSLNIAVNELIMSPKVT